MTYVFHSKANLKQPIHFSYTHDEETACQGAPVMLKELKSKFINSTGVVMIILLSLCKLILFLETLQVSNIKLLQILLNTCRKIL